MIKKSVLSLFVVLFLVSCSLKYDSSVVEDLTCLVHEISTKFTYTSYSSPPMEYTATSTSFHIGGGYIVTCAHCVNFSTPTIVTYDYKFTMYDKPIKLIGTYDDVALLYNKDLIGTPAVRFGDSSKLKQGDNIVNVGNSAMMGNNLKDGMVSMIGIAEPLFGFHKRTAPASMIISIPVNGGDSGSPLFAKKNGQHYFVGMVYASHRGLQGYNIAFMSNYIKSAISEIRNTVTKPI
jgi:S1-C subfamily serine protease